jgi:hypothetical protein
MGTVIFVLGLAGAGKSWLIPFLKVDEAFEEGFYGSEHELHHATLVARLRRGESCAVSEVAFLRPDMRDAYLTRLRAELSNRLHVNWLCFENDPRTANSNCRNRKNKPDDPTGEKHIGINNRVSEGYVIPDGAVVFKIYALSSVAQTQT